MKAALVTTTIRVPYMLDLYLLDARTAQRTDLTCIIIGDRKTPRASAEYCTQLTQNHGYDVRFLSVPDQESYLLNYPELANHLPFNSVQRRNIGLLMAYEQGAQVIISIDDDNFLAEPDFLGQHSIVGQTLELEAFGSPTGWINVCDALREDNGFRFYHRGFPLGAKADNSGLVPTRSSRRGRVVVNAGFWLDEPDVDAVTRLAIPLKVTGYQRSQNFTLARGTWSPFNSQNTALALDAIAGYYLSPCVGRYDDIWAGYVLAAIADHLGDLIAFGRPLVRQTRNAHDIWADLDAERIGMRLTDRFCKYLRDTTFQGRSYAECYEEAVQRLTVLIDRDCHTDGIERACLEQYVDGMRVWLTTLTRAVHRRATKVRP